MMTTRTELDPGLRDLVEDRLDAIERVLVLAGVSRRERASIVEEVEAQVFEMLARRNAGEPTRADVLAVLAALDPPEAYAPEGYRRQLVAEQPREPRPSLLAVGSAALTALHLPMTALLVFALKEDIDHGGLAWLIMAFMVLFVPTVLTLCGAVALWRILRSRGWLYGLPAAFFAATLFPLLLFNGLLVTAVVVLEAIAVYAVLGLAFLALNVAAVYFGWKLTSAGYQRVPVGSPSYVDRASR
jgi:hypothetical protein